MKILAFDSLDSTSTYATRQLDAGSEALPFAVIAKAQTSGRGRSGKSWESPLGGLYFTLVLPPDMHPVPSNRGSLPLWVAAQTAAFLHQRFSIRPTIKWPNDLLFAGQKLAGILCESRLHGNDWGPVLIGIGINLHQAPAVEEQESSSISSITGETDLDAIKIGEELCAFLEKRLSEKDWLKTYEAYALEAGQLWRGEKGDFEQLKAVTADGALVLQSLDHKTSQTINSVSHGYRWVYQLQEAMPLLVADIGNSLCKIAYYADARKSEARILKIDIRDADHPEKLNEFIRNLQLPMPWVMHGITVASRPWEKLQELLSPHQIYLVALPKRNLRTDFSQYHFAQLGIDRVALSEAARHQFRDSPVLVISAGTCITVEALSAKGQYLGGYILPGLQTKLNSLHLRTDRLPLLKIYEEKIPDDLPLFGHDTKGAMISGLIHESVALIEYLIRQMTEKGEAPRVLFTGGDGEILSRFIPGEFRTDLVLEGVRLLTLGGQA
ncbi:MAG: biotin--[acetyl-CoA-carboxylase] ligase [Proteobacteria bacterium]|nr:MAG: biotin--[acetyl-CoA-carboxylase] ligase [Pseudomonadota bacterium]